MTLRKDTEFWQKFSYENAPENIKEKINVWKNRFPSKLDKLSNQRLWPVKSWFTVGSGLDLIDKSIAGSYIENIEEYKDSINLYNKFVDFQNDKVSQCIDHNEFLESLK
jgi:hypothetical protein